MGVAFKGIASDYDTTFIHTCIKKGAIPKFSDKASGNKILISQNIANKLKLKCGDKIFSYFVNGSDIRARRFTVSGIYQTNMAKFDEALCFIDLYSAVKLNGWDMGQVSALEIDIKDFKEVSGKGIEFTYKKDKVKIGNPKYCGIKEESSNIYLTINNSLVADIEIKDEIKSTAKETIKKLKDMNITVHMFTGDTKEKAEEISKELNIEDVNYSMLPNDKYNYLEKIITNKKEGTIVAFVGDGINDAPVLKLADLGISMGHLGTDSAIEASDIVIMNDNLDKIITAINISKKTGKIINQNLIFAIGIKLLVLILTLLGVSTMLEAVFADVGVTVLCILNTLRLLKNNK